MDAVLAFLDQASEAYHASRGSCDDSCADLPYKCAHAPDRAEQFDSWLATLKMVVEHTAHAGLEASSAADRRAVEAERAVALANAEHELEQQRAEEFRQAQERATDQAAAAVAEHERAEDERMTRLADRIVAGLKGPEA
jgi:hypothetical protein